MELGAEKKTADHISDQTIRGLILENKHDSKLNINHPSP